MTRSRFEGAPMYVDPYEKFIHKPVKRKPAETPTVSRMLVDRDFRESEARAARQEEAAKAVEAFRQDLKAEAANAVDAFRQDLKAVMSETISPTDVIEILNLVFIVTGVSVLEMMSERKPASLVKARQIFCWLCRRFTLRSLPGIGQTINRDHTTIIYSVRRVDRVVADLGLDLSDTPEAWAEALWAAVWP